MSIKVWRKPGCNRPTYSITKDFDWSDTENNRLLFEMTAKYGTPYFSNYVNSDMKPSDIRSMCPMTHDTSILVKSEQNGIRHMKIGDIYTSVKLKGTKYEVWTPSGWKYGKPIQIPMTKVYKIKLSNGTFVRFGENHLQPVKENGLLKTLKAKELKPGMWIPFNKKPIDSVNIGTEELGYAIGAFLGDGSYDGQSVIYSLNNTTKQNVVEKLAKIWNDLGFETRLSSEKDSLLKLTVKSNPKQIIERYVKGNNALNKTLTKLAFNSSTEFKNGLLLGFRDTDGCVEKKRLYTSSSKLRNDIQYLLACLGKKALINYEDNRDGRLGSETNYRIDYPERNKYGELYDEDDDYIYYSIIEIEEVSVNGKYLYCFELDTDDHLFMLSNGLITHNCRLRLDLRELRKKTGGYFGSGESTGSIGVVTINMPRIAYLAKDKEDFYNRLERLMDISARSLKTKRTVVTKYLEDGLYPYTKKYLGSFNNHFSTIGLVGMNEAGLNAKWLRKDMTHKETQEFTKEVLQFMLNKLSDYQEKYGDLYNLEATPKK